MCILMTILVIFQLLRNIKGKQNYLMIQGKRFLVVNNVEEFLKDVLKDVQYSLFFLLFPSEKQNV